MDWRSFARVVVIASAMAGCAFDSVAESDAGPSTVGPSTEDSGASGPLPSTAGTGSEGQEGQEGQEEEVGSESSAGSSTSATTTGVVEGARVVIDDHDFGVIAPGASDMAMMTVSNEGDVAATDIAGSELAAPFAFAGGAYPGAEGTCGASLGAGKTCTIAIGFWPPAFGAWDGEVVLAYAGGDEAEAHAAIAGASAGTTGNLLVNGDAETGGDPPTGWSNVFGSWLTREDASIAHGGTRTIYGGPFADVATAQLRQIVVLTGYETIADAGQLGYAFAGFARSFATNDDPYQIRVVFLAGDNSELGAYDSLAQYEVAYQALADTNMLPAGTRSIAVDLFCHKLNGSNCSAFFDDLSLTLSYVAP